MSVLQFEGASHVLRPVVKYRPCVGSASISGGGIISSPAAHAFAAYGASNWIWLSHQSQFGRVVELGGATEHALGLAAHFEQVVRVAPRDRTDPLDLAPSDADGAVLVARGWPSEVPLPDASVDCVALRQALTVKGRWAIGPALREARRLLHGGGCVSFGFDNSAWASTTRLHEWQQILKRDATISVRRVRAQVEAAGFGELELFYADPWFQRPATLLPCTRRVTAFYELHKPMQSRTRLPRMALARLGLHRFLHPAYLAIAYV